MLPLHILSFGFVVGVTAVADKEALGWMRGAQRVLDGKRLRNYHVLVWIGLVALIVTGIMLLYPTRMYLLSDVLFDIKLLFVGMLVVNAALIGRLQEHAAALPFAEVAARDKRALFLSGAVSLMGWISAAGIAFLMFD